MDIQTLTTFFMWCMIFNVGILIFWGVFLMFGMDFVYRLHSKWFRIPRETFDVVIYSFLAVYKIAFVVFSLVPYLALLSIAS